MIGVGCNNLANKLRPLIFWVQTFVRRFQSTALSQKSPPCPDEKRHEKRIVSSIKLRNATMNSETMNSNKTSRLVQWLRLAFHPRVWWWLYPIWSPIQSYEFHQIVISIQSLANWVPQFPDIFPSNPMKKITIFPKNLGPAIHHSTSYGERHTHNSRAVLMIT